MTSSIEVGGGGGLKMGGIDSAHEMPFVRTLLAWACKIKSFLRGGCRIRNGYLHGKENKGRLYRLRWFSIKRNTTLRICCSSPRFGMQIHVEAVLSLRLRTQH